MMYLKYIMRSRQKLMPNSNWFMKICYMSKLLGQWLVSFWLLLFVLFIVDIIWFEKFLKSINGFLLSFPLTRKIFYKLDYPFYSTNPYPLKSEIDLSRCGRGGMFWCGVVSVMCTVHLPWRLES